jgi:hypothetical protein
MKMNQPTRRQFLAGSGALGISALGLGGIALRAAATGLPAWFLADPLKASAQQMDCAVEAQGKMQFLVVSASSAGDSHSCNCPGTYDDAAIIHPSQEEFTATEFTLGDKMVTAAQIWSTLSEDVRARSNFFHHITGGTVHGDHPAVMRFLGRSTGGEMWPSIYAKHLAPCLGTVQAEPVAVGSAGNALEFVAYSGRTLPTVSPTQLKQLLTGSARDPLVGLRPLRDKTLDDLNRLFKETSSPAQSAFLDAMAASQAQVRQLSESLSSTLTAISNDKVGGQALAAAALIAAKVSPVITLHIPFGGDNHEDGDLYDEWFDHTDHDATQRGVAGIQAVADALASLDLTDQVTFATMNVFGRDLSGTAKVEGRSGRDHFGNHSVMMMFGKNVVPGVTGGTTDISGGVYGAADIDSSTGGKLASGGDIARADSHVSAAKTLGVALGISAQDMDKDFTDSGTVKYVAAAVSSS